MKGFNLALFVMVTKLSTPISNPIILLGSFLIISLSGISKTTSIVNIL